MPEEGVSLFKTRDEILADMQAEAILAVPDAYLGTDSVLNFILNLVAGAEEGVFQANQIVAEDMFILTANPNALDRHGEEHGVPRKSGTVSNGTLKFTGAGGTVVNIGAEVAYDPATGEDLRYFQTTDLGTIPNPGVPGAPTLTDLATAGNLDGTYEYVITFLTDAGETEPGTESQTITVLNSQVRLTNIPIGGPGTTGRRIYRQVDGGGYGLVTTINDNVTVQYDDNLAATGAAPPESSTALAIEIPAQSEESGEGYNVAVNTIRVLTDVPDGVTDVTNTTPFTGGTDAEDTEDYRIRLLEAIRNPGTGSPTDLKTWAEEVDGVESATVYTNDNEGTPTPGHVTIRISGPDGSVPPSDVIDAVQTTLEARDLANVTIHTTTFVATPTDVDVTITPSDGFTVADVEGAVILVISDYINSLEVGETLRVAGIYGAVFGLPGVEDVVVNSPTTNQATGSSAKRTVGTITVN